MFHYFLSQKPKDKKLPLCNDVHDECPEDSRNEPFDVRHTHYIHIYLELVINFMTTECLHIQI